MTYVSVKKDGVGAIQQDAPYNNFYALNDGLAVFQKPSGSYGTGAFQNTCHPLESNNVRWSSARCKLTTKADSTPGQYRTIVQLWGIINSGKEELIAEYVSSNISTTEETREVVFNLANCGGSPELNHVDNSGTSGKFHINLPFRYKHLSDVRIRNVWLQGWSYMRVAYLAGGTPGVVSKELVVTITVPWETGINTDFTDIRFTHPDGKTFLCFHRSEYVASTYAVFKVSLDTIAPSPYYTPILIHFGNSSATTDKSAPFMVYRVHDDFEDAQYGAGRVFPYRQWWNLHGTTSIVSGTDKISGTYSVNHTGNGSDDPSNIFYNTLGVYDPDGCRIEADFKIKTQGVGSETPYAWLSVPRYQADGAKVNLIDTHYDGTNQKIRFLSYYDGSMHIAADATWMAGKVPAGTTYHLTVIDTGTNMRVWINNVLYIDADYTNHIRVGHYGMGGNRDTSITFDNICICRHSAVQPLTFGAVSATVSDSFDDNSINTSIWTAVTHGNATVAETGAEIRITNTSTGDRAYLRTVKKLKPPYQVTISGKIGSNVEFATHWDGAYDTGEADIVTNGYHIWYQNWSAPYKFQVMERRGGATIATLSEYTATMDANYHTYLFKVTEFRTYVYIDGVFRLSYKSDNTAGDFAMNGRETPTGVAAYYNNYYFYGMGQAKFASQYNIAPDGTPGDDATSLTFSRPWNNLPTPGYVYGLELGSSEGYISNIVRLEDKGVYNLGYDGVDKYQALRFKTSVEGDYTCNVSLSDFVYEYEVLR